MSATLDHNIWFREECLAGGKEKWDPSGEYLPSSRTEDDSSGAGDAGGPNSGARDGSDSVGASENSSAATSTRKVTEVVSAPSALPDDVNPPARLRQRDPDSAPGWRADNWI